MRRSYNFRHYSAGRILATKGGRRVSVCLPARDEAATVGQTIRAIRRELMDTHDIVDEIIVIDDGSSDSTAAVATAAGARVVAAGGVLREYGPEGGKGQAMWKAVNSATGDFIVFCDADIQDFDPGFVLGLIGPLLERDDVTFVKGFYERPLDGRPGEGGRVTELMARPLISVFFPHLADLAQPLSGECAAPRDVLEAIPFIGGYGVDLGLLIDVTERFGDHGLVQCDLGTRVHRNRPLSDLGPQALAILQAVLRRSGVHADGEAGLRWTDYLLRPGAEPAAVSFTELPPLVEVPSHRKSA